MGLGTRIFCGPSRSDPLPMDGSILMGGIGGGGGGGPLFPENIGGAGGGVGGLIGEGGCSKKLCCQVDSG